MKTAAPIIQPTAAQSAAGPSHPKTLRKRRHVPSFTAPGLTHRQVLVSFGKGLAQTSTLLGCTMQSTRPSPQQMRKSLSSPRDQPTTAIASPPPRSPMLRTWRSSAVQSLPFYQRGCSTGSAFPLPCRLLKSSTFHITQILSTRLKPPSLR